MLVTVGIGGLSIIAGLLLLQTNFLLVEFARISGVNFVHDGEPVSYAAPGLLFVVPVLLVVAGGIALGGGVAAIFRKTATAAPPL